MILVWTRATARPRSCDSPQNGNSSTYRTVDHYSSLLPKAFADEGFVW